MKNYALNFETSRTFILNYKISADELNVILYNIERDEKLGFDYSTIQEEKSKVLAIKNK